MADYITPEEVPSAGSLENILGFDASGRWAKMGGNVVTQATNNAAAAVEAAQNAQVSAGSALTTATGAKYAAERTLSLLSDVYAVASGRNAEVYIGWVVNGLADPNATAPPFNQPNPVRNLIFASFGGDFSVGLRSGGFVFSSPFYGELSVVTIGADELRLNVDGEEVCVVTKDSTGESAGIMATIFIVGDGTSAHVGIKNVAGGTVSVSNGTLIYPSYVGGDGSTFTPEDRAKLDGIEAGANKTVVDSALSLASANPVQNKVVYTELKGKSSIYGVLYGTSIIPGWNETGQVIFLPGNTSTVTIRGNTLYSRAKVNSTISCKVILSSVTQKTFKIHLSDEKLYTITITGLSSLKKYVVDVIAAKYTGNSEELYYTVTEAASQTLDSLQ